MDDEVRDHIIRVLARNRVCVLSASGSFAAWAVAAQYGHVSLGLECQVPRWSEVVYHLEQDPHATVIVVDAEADPLCWLHYRGVARTGLGVDDRYVAIHIEPERIDLIDEGQGWGARETLEL